MQRLTKFAACVALALVACSLEGCEEQLKALQEHAEAQLKSACDAQVTQALAAAEATAKEGLMSACDGNADCEKAGALSEDATVATNKELMVEECVSAMKNMASDPGAAKKWMETAGSGNLAGAGEQLIADNKAAAAEADKTEEAMKEVMEEKKRLYLESVRQRTRMTMYAKILAKNRSSSPMMLGGIVASCALLAVASAAYALRVYRKRMAATTNEENELLTEEAMIE
eukprot:gnl/TRDRNA2_/TRDRNA2_173659_c0_seq1.p1 gnl/TRDRNA2_/TRDRNA2_173659_c0~~gnl/TRDRNA2_/TRDRNA2_173659_c0_seq1.p1  ORF type:complete len:229 (+),score=69.93 gnl/TRDRNA2_/TRDRNA2_173659_c0_seq1:88-774(+)